MPESQQDINIAAEPSLLYARQKLQIFHASSFPRAGVAMTTAEREEPLVIFDKMSDEATEERVEK